MSLENEAITMTLQELLSEARKLSVKDQLHLATQLLQWTELQVQPSVTNRQKRQRIAGLNPGACVMADDFDEPLPDSFWLGQE